MQFCAEQMLQQWPRPDKVLTDYEALHIFIPETSQMRAVRAVVAN